MGYAKSQTRKALLKTLVFISIFGVVLFNAIAFNHARSMLMFTDNGVRTEKPEHLGFGEKSLILIKGINVPKPKNHSTPDLYGLSYEVYQNKCKQ